MEKLSELIRRGAKMVDGQCQGDYIQRDGDKVLCCAGGAAFYALTGNLPLSAQEYKRLRNADMPTPLAVLADAGYRLFNFVEDIDVVEWNDTFGMSFEAIADSLEEKGY